MAKKKFKTGPVRSKPLKEEEEVFDEELNTSDADEDNDFFPDENDYEPEIDPEEIPDTEEDPATAKRKVSNSCQREGYCTRCDGDHSEPQGLCTCRCHDIA